MSITFQKATRHAVKLKIGIDGPSGAGKTMGALALAHGITNGGRIAVADSENSSASLYASRYEFDTVTVREADPQFLREVIAVAVEAKYDALVIDSLTHAWQFVLNAKDDHDRANPKSNSWTNWRKFAPLWEGLMAEILNAPIHIIATMRSKQAYEQVENAGRKQIVKLGLQPQVRDGAEYEFGLVFSVNHNHRAEATKDRTALFSGDQIDLCDAKVHAQLVRWMNEGGPTAAPTEPTPADQPDRADDDKTFKGKRLGEYTTEELEKIIAAAGAGAAHKNLVKACRNVLANRSLGNTTDDAVNRMKASVDAENALLPF